MYPVLPNNSPTGSNATLFSPAARAAAFNDISFAAGTTITYNPFDAPTSTIVLNTRSTGFPTFAATDTPSMFPSETSYESVPYLIFIVSNNLSAFVFSTFSFISKPALRRFPKFCEDSRDMG